jgi:hypothetical protein
LDPRSRCGRPRRRRDSVAVGVGVQGVGLEPRGVHGRELFGVGEPVAIAVSRGVPQVARVHARVGAAVLRRTAVFGGAAVLCGAPVFAHDAPILGWSPIFGDATPVLDSATVFARDSSVLRGAAVLAAHASVRSGAGALSVASVGASTAVIVINRVSGAAWAGNGQLVSVRYGTPSPYRFQDGLYVTDVP